MSRYNNWLSDLLNIFKISGHPKQEPYTSNFFRIFVNIYNETKGDCHFALIADDLAKEWKQEKNYNENYFYELSLMWSGGWILLIGY